MYRCCVGAETPTALATVADVYVVYQVSATILQLYLMIVKIWLKHGVPILVKRTRKVNIVQMMTQRVLCCKC